MIIVRIFVDVERMKRPATKSAELVRKAIGLLFSATFIRITIPATIVTTEITAGRIIPTERKFTSAFAGKTTSPR